MYVVYDNIQLKDKSEVFVNTVSFLIKRFNHVIGVFAILDQVYAVYLRSTIASCSMPLCY